MLGISETGPDTSGPAKDVVVRNTSAKATEVPLCPSARPDMDSAVLFGVIGGSVEAPRLIPLATPLAVTNDLLALSSPASPTEVFRFSAPCAGSGCQHFDGTDCQLATRIVELLPPVVHDLPVCHLRPACRWWQQEGRAACMRCPQVVSENYAATHEMELAATPVATPGFRTQPRF